MIDKERIEKLRKELGFSDKGIFEKTILAFDLLSNLLKFYPDLIFKGGTSLLLHHYPPIRLSIDVDVLLHEKDKQTLYNNLTTLAQSSDVFKSVEEDERESKIPKAHYKFYYDSHFSSKEQYILLDIVFSESAYHKIVEKKLAGHPMIFSGADNVVKISTPDGLFGDKLTATSEKTTGLKLTQGRDMEFIKQIIDLGGLFDLISNVDDIHQTFIKTAIQESEFRGSKFSNDEIFDDILEIAFKYSQSLLKSADNSYNEIAYINKGLNRIQNHLLNRINPSGLKLSFAKIAYVINLLRNKKTSSIVKDAKLANIENMHFEGKYVVLEGLKKLYPQTYTYWLLACGQK